MHFTFVENARADKGLPALPRRGRGHTHAPQPPEALT